MYPHMLHSHLFDSILGIKVMYLARLLFECIKPIGCNFPFPQHLSIKKCVFLEVLH